MTYLSEKNEEEVLKFKKKMKYFCSFGTRPKSHESRKSRKGP